MKVKEIEAQNSKAIYLRKASEMQTKIGIRMIQFSESWNISLIH